MRCGRGGRTGRGGRPWRRTSHEPRRGQAVHPVDQVLPVPQARDLRLPARAGVLRRRRHRADPAGHRDRPDAGAARVPDQRRPVHLRDRLDHPDHRVLEDRRPAAAAAGRDLRRRRADDQHRARRGRRGARPEGDLRRRHHRRHRRVPDRPVLRQAHPASSRRSSPARSSPIIGVVLLSVAAADAAGGVGSQFADAHFGGARATWRWPASPCWSSCASTGSSGASSHHRRAHRPGRRHRRRSDLRLHRLQPASATPTGSA